MTSKAKMLRDMCSRYIDNLEDIGATDSVVITALRSLVSQNAATTENARRLWQDNQTLRKSAEEIANIERAK